MSEIEPRIVININPDVSIADLSARMAEGYSVVRSAHVGNLRPYNLTLAAAGIPILAVDHTITGVDTSYFPELVLNRSQSEQVSGLGVIVSRAAAQQTTVTHDATRPVQFVDELHIAAVEAAIPGAKMFSNTEYLRTHETISAEIIQLALERQPELFRRVVNSDGIAQNRASEARALAQSGRVLQLLDDPRSPEAAALVPNAVDIAINFVIEALDTERETIFHLSGPDMVRYIGTLTDTLDALYASIRSETSFGSRLPPQLDVQLVPSAHAKFATTTAQQPVLDQLLAAAEEQTAMLAETHDRRREFFSSPASQDPEARTQTLAGFKATEAAVEAQLAIARDNLPELMPAQGSTGYVTQYDVLAEGGLYVPDVNLQLTMTQLNILDRQISRARSNSP
ncbi:MAG: hypothetical protein KIH63_000915 [Candidatus Saccharibacteria bacterium]|nr:hypothetical protein [Candidatus Saccharibacteria bacterium]